jgi:spore germination cell wall hydrolase CwlJ-like protein
MSDTLTVAKTIYGEARGGRLACMIAVACVIRNRAQHPRVRWWGVGYSGVCLKPFQFSCWNTNDPNRKVLEALDHVPPPPVYSLAKAVAADIIDGLIPDITGGADHYHTLDVAPDWAEGVKPIKRIGQHVFYKLH